VIQYPQAKNAVDRAAARTDVGSPGRMTGEPSVKL
jgi:hypothetical protein